jgi:hypothetical protein
MKTRQIIRTIVIIMAVNLVVDVVSDKLSNR